MAVCKYTAPMVSSRVNSNNVRFTEEALAKSVEDHHGMILPVVFNFRADEVLGSAMISGLRRAEDGASELLVNLELDSDEFSKRFPDGSQRPYSLLGCSVKDGDGKMVGEQMIVTRFQFPHVGLSYNTADHKLTRIEPVDGD